MVRYFFFIKFVDSNANILISIGTAFIGSYNVLMIILFVLMYIKLISGFKLMKFASKGGKVNYVQQ
jgi:hypothetical protein